MGNWAHARVAFGIDLGNALEDGVPGWLPSDLLDTGGVRGTEILYYGTHEPHCVVLALRGTVIREGNVHIKVFHPNTWFGRSDKVLADTFKKTLSDAGLDVPSEVEPRWFIMSYYG